VLTKLLIDEKLIEEARCHGGHKTKKAAVIAALKEYVGRRKQQRILSQFGSFNFDPKDDYKAARGKQS
jgi:Arc/MetJ family transcription regulator